MHRAESASQWEALLITGRRKTRVLFFEKCAKFVIYFYHETSGLFSRSIKSMRTAKENIPARRSPNLKKYLLAAGVIVVAGVLLQQYFKMSDGAKKPSPSPRPGAPAEKISVKVDTAGWNEYANTKLGFSIKYPQNVTLRGTEDSDFAILTLDRAETDGKQALIALTRKKIPIGQQPYATMEDFWKYEERMIAAQGGNTSNARYVEVNGRIFFEVREDNRQNNYMGLHRYIKEPGGIYEVTLTMEGEKLFPSAVERYNKILTAFAAR